MAKLWRPKVQQGIAGHLAVRGGTALETVQQALDALVARYRSEKVLTAVKHIPAREAQFRPMPAWVHPRTSRGLARERHRKTIFPPRRPACRSSFNRYFRTFTSLSSSGARFGCHRRRSHYSRVCSLFSHLQVCPLQSRLPDKNGKPWRTIDLSRLRTAQ